MVVAPLFARYHQPFDYQEVVAVVLQNLAVYFLENLDFVDSAAVGLGFAPDFGQNCFAADFVLAVADFSASFSFISSCQLNAICVSS